MTGLDELANDLKTHRSLCEEVLRQAESEMAAVDDLLGGQRAERTAAKKKVLAQLTQSLDKIREHRVAWLKVEPTVRQEHPEITELLRENQNLIMKILVIDRENEKGLLRRGLVPNREIPPARRQQPHFVANLYRRNSYA